MAKIDSLALGVAGELRVLSELILHDFIPAWSLIDRGKDIVLEDGLKIQVKTSRQVKVSENSRQYRFNLKKDYRKYSGDRIKNAWDGKGADFVIAWCYESGNFYIIPSEELKGKWSFEISEDSGRYKVSRSKYDKYKNNWEILRGWLK